MVFRYCAVGLFSRRERARFPLIEIGFSRMEDGAAGERRRGLKRARLGYALWIMFSCH